MIPTTSHADLLAAFELFDREQRPTAPWSTWEQNRNHKHAILHDGRHYPVKEIISLATGQPVNSFSGGEEANRYVSSFGFEVVPLRESQDDAAQPARRRFWKVSAGRGGVDWSLFLSGGLIAIDYTTEFGDIRGANPSSPGELKAYLESTGAWGDKVSDYLAKQFWQFYAEMQPGDGVCATGSAAIIGIGVITGPYEYVVADQYSYRRAVDWQFTESIPTSTLGPEVKAKLGQVRTITELSQGEFEALEAAADKRLSDAAAVIERLLPDPTERRLALELFADAIATAHHVAPTKWSISLYPDHVWLNVGRVAVMELARQPWILLDRPTAENALPSVSTRLMPAHKTLPESCGLSLEAGDLPELTTALRSSQEVVIGHAAAAVKALKPAMRAAHRPVVLQYLRRELGRQIPDPSHAEVSDGTPQIWWVYQGRALATATDLGVVWVPSRTSGKSVPEFDRVEQFRPGDVLIHSAGGRVHGLSRVGGTWEPQERPQELPPISFAGPGRSVKVDYFPLPRPIKTGPLADAMRAAEPSDGPWHYTSGAQQGSIWPFNLAALQILKDASDDVWPEWVPVDATRSWVFQANPKSYDLQAALGALSEMAWRVPQRTSEVQIGDEVFLYECGPAASVLALARIISAPAELPVPAEELPFFHDESFPAKQDPRVRIRIERTLDPPLSRSRIQAEPELAALSIFKGWQGSNFLLDSRSAAKLRSLMTTSAPDASFESILLGLAAENLTFSPEVVSNYLLALQSKRFVILSGISGTGKTQLALCLAKQFQKRVQVTTPTALPEGATPVELHPSSFKYRRIMLPMSLVRRMQLPPLEADRNSATLQVRYPGGETQLRYYLDVRDTRTAAPLLFNAEFRSWFEEHLQVGDRIYLDLIPGEEGALDGLEIFIAGTSTTSDELQPTYEVVAVRPDWTDNRGLLGYYNPISQSYRSTPFLELLIKAEAEWRAAQAEGSEAHPYFLILDEMNLARVEHYFSDFLSCLESGEPLHLHDDPAIEAGVTDDGMAVPRRLCIPPNLFFTGTVNVDETTFMFSPKVLDRAFTIEFNDVDLRGLGGAGMAAGDLALSRFPGRLYSNGKPAATHWRRLQETHPELQSTLIELHDLLEPDHRHFGYRVANEIAAFINLAAEQADETNESIRTALDLAILQKVLPKFHGTQQELERPLQSLFSFAVAGSSGEGHLAGQWACSRGRLGPTADHPMPHVIPAFPRSSAKIWRMLRRLQQQGFTSFME